MNKKFAITMIVSIALMIPLALWGLSAKAQGVTLSFPKINMEVFQETEQDRTVMGSLQETVEEQEGMNEPEESPLEPTEEVLGQNSEETVEQTEVLEEPSEEETPFVTSTVDYFDDALFIGDSRTVGLSEYADLGEADVFASTGMSVYKIFKSKLRVKDVGKCKLDYLLSNKTYGKIYVMIGINELGYDRENMMQKYTELITTVREKQPDATLYLMANLHVSAKKSQEDNVYNNASIDSLNASIKDMCDNTTIFYIDVNPLFDDEMGNLAADYTADDSHVKAKYYEQWGTWLLTQTIEK